MIRWLAIAVAMLAVKPAFAAVVVLSNLTEAEVRFSLTQPGNDPQFQALGSGDSRAFPCGRSVELGFTSEGKPVRYRLDAFHSYIFSPGKDGPALTGVELSAAMPKADDLPEMMKPPGLYRIPVQLLVDDAELRAKPVWEKAIAERVVAVSAIFERQCGVAFEIVSINEWKSDPASNDLHFLLADFEKKVKPAPAKLAIGFTSRAVKPANDKDPSTIAGCTRGPFAGHLLVREGHPKSESERVEVLAHELAHWLGAAHTPDPRSALRPTLGDGKAALAKFKIGIDPLNLLAVSIWTEELRSGKVNAWADLKPAAKDRLKAVYKTLEHLLPDDPVAGQLIRQLDGLAVEVAKNPDEPGGVVERPMPRETVKVSPLYDAVKKVVKGVTIRAGDLVRLPANERPKGDKLTAEYVKTAADLALTVDDKLQVPAFLLGLGIALDDSTVLRDNPVSGSLCKAVETDTERKERIAVLGVPTVRHRRDLCQHFVVSVALVELIGPEGAETIGLTKELLDKERSSGFSFADLCADFAGVAFAKKLKAKPGLLGELRGGFAVEDHVPSIIGLREGLSSQRFIEDFGDTADPRFAKAIEEVRKRVAEGKK